jgi:hypothetical protein
VPQVSVPIPLIDAVVFVAAKLDAAFKSLTGPGPVVKVTPAAIFNPEGKAELLLNVIEATRVGGEALTVTISPALIITLSVVVGTPTGVHVDAVFQSVLPVLVF